MRMPVESIDARMFAPCGMNCMVCYRHCSHKRPCAGCLGSGAGQPAHCRNCAVKDCVRERGLSHCHACGDYPCGRIRALEKSYRARYRTSLVENGFAVRQHGVAAFLEQQKERYTCPHCGGIISLHDAACSECGAGAPEEG